MTLCQMQRSLERDRNGKYRFYCPVCARTAFGPSERYYRQCRPGAGGVTSAAAPPTGPWLVAVREPQAPQNGPGTELKKLLARLGIQADVSCPCSFHAAEMDRLGPAGCREHLEMILGWLKEEAQRRGLPFSEFAARQLVKLAIRRARNASDHEP